MHAALICVHVFPVFHDLLVAALELAPDSAGLFRPLRRLCAVAHDAGHHDSGVVALLEPLEMPSFAGTIPSAWLVEGCSTEGEADYWLRRLVRR